MTFVGTNDQGGKSAFVYDATVYKSKGTDRCGDGIMDGPITLTKVGTDGTGTGTIVIRAAA